MSERQGGIEPLIIMESSLKAKRWWRLHRRRHRRRRRRLVTSRLKRNDEKVGLAWKLAFAQLEAAASDSLQLDRRIFFLLFHFQQKPPFR